jgi:hypothetical protein
MRPTEKRSEAMPHASLGCLWSWLALNSKFFSMCQLCMTAQWPVDADEECGAAGACTAVHVTTGLLAGTTPPKPEVQF